MIRDTDAHRSAAQSDAVGAAPDTTPLANRVALLTFASAFALIVALVALPTAMNTTDGTATRVAAAVPVAATVALMTWATYARVHLLRARLVATTRPSSPHVPNEPGERTDRDERDGGGQPRVRGGTR